MIEITLPPNARDYAIIESSQDGWAFYFSINVCRYVSPQSCDKNWKTHGGRFLLRNIHEILDERRR